MPASLFGILNSGTGPAAATDSPDRTVCRHPVLLDRCRPQRATDVVNFLGAHGGVGKFDSDPVLGDGDRRDGEFVVAEGRAVDGAAFVGDQDVRLQDQASAPIIEEGR